MNNFYRYLFCICLSTTALVTNGQNYPPIQSQISTPEFQTTLNMPYEWIPGERESFQNILYSPRFGYGSWGLLNMNDVDQLRALKDLLDVLPSDRVMKTGGVTGIGSYWDRYDPCWFQNHSNTKQHFDNVAINYKLPAFFVVPSQYTDPVFEINTVNPCGNNVDPVLYIDESKQFGFGTNQPASTYHFVKPDFQIGDDSQFKFKINGHQDDEYLLISKNGNDLFKVNNAGKVYAREFEITLTTSFPDYVFAPTYKLLSIAELDQFIKTNKHLPGIASANDYESKGTVNMGELQLQMLEKIEELTLYLIHQQQMLDKQQQEIEALKHSLTKNQL